MTGIAVEEKRREQNRLAVKRYKERHPERIREASRLHKQRQRAERQERIEEARSQPCVDCGIQLPQKCMHLDHVHDTKSFRWKYGKVSASKADFEAELAKCEVRCPNCHSLRHYYEDHPEEKP